MSEQIEDTINTLVDMPYKELRNMQRLMEDKHALEIRVRELEQINEDHRILNGELRSSVICDCFNDAESFEGACRNEVLDIANVLISKQYDYGQENILVFGEEGIVVRLSDKVHRLINLFKNRNAKPQNESVQDTFIDIAGYAILGLMLQKKTFQLPMKLDNNVES